MTNALESMSLGSIALGLAIISSIVAWLLTHIEVKPLMWVSGLATPFALAYGIYWLPVWMGREPSESGYWAFFVITTWSIAGVVPAAGIMVISQTRKRVAQSIASGRARVAERLK